MPKKLNLHRWSESVDLPLREESGTQIRRCTNAPALTINVYHEQPYCSADGNRFAMLRTTDPATDKPFELLMYDIESHRVARLQQNVLSRTGCAAYSGRIVASVDDGDSYRYILFDLNTLEIEELFAWDKKPLTEYSTAPHFDRVIYSVSADGKYGLMPLRTGKQCFGIAQIEMASGKWDIIYESPDIANPHLAYRLHSGERIMVQENRGARVYDGGNLERPFDERGVGLFTINRSGGDRKSFPVGPPHTASTTGHQVWVGDSDRVLVTVSAPYNDGERTGTILEVSHEWEKPRVVFDTEYSCNHISVSACGRYFVADAYVMDYEEERMRVPIIVGNIETGTWRVLCDARTSGGGSQFNHAHPYMTTDNKYVVYNSNRTGLCQVYIASLPEEFLKELDSID